MFLPGRFYRRSRHHEGKFLRCYLSPGVSRRCRGAPEVLRRFIPRKLGDITRDGTFSILSGRGIMLHRRVNSEHFVRYFTCQPRNEKRWLFAICANAFLPPRTRIIYAVVARYMYWAFLLSLRQNLSWFWLDVVYVKWFFSII